MRSHVTSKVINGTDRSSPSKLGGMSAAEMPAQGPEFPTHHSLKLCILGKAFSGKKTQAKFISEKFGGKVTIFDMSEILREALAYVDPNA